MPKMGAILTQQSKTNTPAALTGGVGRRLDPLGQELQSVESVVTDAPDEYAQLLAWGWDTVQEAWHVHIPEDIEHQLDEWKSKAQEDRDGGGVYVCQFGGYTWQMNAVGAKGGVKWVMQNDDVMLLIRGSGCAWGLSVRYLSAGLWEHGWDMVHNWIAEFISAWFEPSDEYQQPRVSRADWAFDFYSPQFTSEFSFENIRPLIVCHSSTKYHAVGTSQNDQTLTIGRVNSLQLTVYDKGREITEASGKSWMENVWAAQSWGELPYMTDKPTDVWRLEIRMGKEYLKNRNVREVSDVREYRAELLAAALKAIRLAHPEGEGQVRNRPMHPLWQLAYETVAVEEVLPIGRKVTGRRAALVDQARAQIAGALRSAAVLEFGEASPEGLELVLSQVHEHATNDPEARKKELSAMGRYEFVDEAR